MAWYSIGPSSYPDLKGQTQYVNSARIAQQFLSLKRDFDAMKIAEGSGDRLSPNEARRTRSRQQALYSAYLRNGYPIAAYPYTSRHDEVVHGNAVDVGVTMPDGTNRALTDAEFDWMHTHAETRGFTWTGRYFNEPWHIEGATRAEVYPPYPGITPENATPSKPTTPNPPIPKLEEDDMARPTLIKTETGQYLAIGSTIVSFTTPAEVSAFLKDNKDNYDTVTLKNSVAQRLLEK